MEQQMEGWLSLIKQPCRRVGFFMELSEMRETYNWRGLKNSFITMNLGYRILQYFPTHRNLTGLPVLMLSFNKIYMLCVNIDRCY